MGWNSKFEDLVWRVFLETQMTAPLPDHNPPVTL